MSTVSLGISVAIGLATTALLAFAGLVTGKRAAGAESRGAVLAFAAWWYAASLVILNQTLRTILFLAGAADARFLTALAHLGNVPLAAALGCLMYYILFLLTGRRSLRVPIAFVYSSYFLYLTWYTARVGERTIVAEDWQVQLVGELTSTAAENLLFGLLLAAPVVTTVAAFTIFAFRIREPDLRYRLGMMSAGFLILFGTILLAYLVGWTDEAWFPLSYQVPALVLSLLVVLAYRPPGWVGRRIRPQAVPSVVGRSPDREP